MIIYEIVCNITGERYIGSTKQELKKRIEKHKDVKQKHPCSSKQIIQRGDFVSRVLEEGDDIGREREQHYIDTLDNINNYRAYGHDLERYKKYYKDRRKNPVWIARQKVWDKNRYNFKKSWGGHPDKDNNLLRINLDLFK